MSRFTSNLALIYMYWCIETVNLPHDKYIDTRKGLVPMDELYGITNAGWNFDNSYSRLPDLFFSVVNPMPVSNPRPFIINSKLAELLGIDSEALVSNNGIEVLSGSRTPEGGFPIAQAYAGHQFGHFTILGDGRALLLGEQITPTGERLDIQLKGSGRTPYSRGGDGRAALGPMLREYIISEAMHALGIPTTRSLAVITTGEAVFRERSLPGAILARVATSHIRVGTFQFAAHQGTEDNLKALADYTIRRHFPDVEENEDRYLALLRHVIKRQAKLIANWQLVGFVHGVMNTDNMTISGETIDYGPCAFMDAYDPATVFSSIDSLGRYAYGNQPHIAKWNLTRFAETLVPLLNKDSRKATAIAEDAVSEFSSLFQANWLAGMRNKIGLLNEEKQDEVLINDLLNLMQKQHSDYTNTFLALTFEPTGLIQFREWYGRWQDRLHRQQETTEEVFQVMKRSNPVVIPRNHLVEEALKAAVDHKDITVMERLLKALENPYAHSREQAPYTELPPPSGCKYRTFCGT